MKPDVERVIMSKVKVLERLSQRVLPVKVGRAAVNQVEDNFRKGGFYGRSWEEPIRSRLGFKGTQNGPLLSSHNHLSRSTRYQPEPYRVKIYNDVEYAQIHNDGGRIRVTAKMKKFFWYKHISTKGLISISKKGKVRNNQRNRAISTEAEFWKRMALKKVGSYIKMPKRRFLGEHPKLEASIKAIIEKELSNFIQQYGRDLRSTH